MNLFDYEPYDPLQGRDVTANEGRLTVHNIISSYHGNYDLFAESVQNAMDAIHERWRSDGESGYVPRIIVIVDLRANTFAVIDNGVGISGEDCKKVFAPNYSLKSRLIAGGGKSCAATKESVRHSLPMASTVRKLLVRTRQRYCSLAGSIVGEHGLLVTTMKWLGHCSCSTRKTLETSLSSTAEH